MVEQKALREGGKAHRCQPMRGSTVSNVSMVASGVDSSDWMVVSVL